MVFRGTCLKSAENGFSAEDVTGAVENSDFFCQPWTLPLLFFTTDLFMPQPSGGHASTGPAIYHTPYIQSDTRDKVQVRRDLTMALSGDGPLGRVLGANPSAAPSRTSSIRSLSNARSLTERHTELAEAARRDFESDSHRQFPVLWVEDEEANWKQERSVFGAGVVRKSAHELNDDRAHDAEVVKKVRLVVYTW